jgi:intracellular septation protein
MKQRRTMTEKTISPKMKALLEFGPVVVFFLGYLTLRDRSFMIAGAERDGLILITAIFVPLIMFTTFMFWRLTGKVSKMQLVTLVVVVVFGGMTIWFNDERFIKMKPTIIYLIFAGILGIGLLRGKSYLRVVMEEMMPLKQEGWMILTKRFALFFLGLAIANEIVWRTMSTDAWVNFKTFGLTLAIFGFFMAQGRLLQTYSTAPDDAT